ncbi:ABC transporter permease [Chitinophaga horti]|uniref:ABC transporter permease n=1 Tax=Chitinophaga horti TaxID=2920382 RepID=A0ABY6J3L1_9BACT|nr:ABC transporter permease [Chitinophaga horti]UYQ92921.1 ABC transporter permease [Chitinophaga horti]
MRQFFDLLKKIIRTGIGRVRFLMAGIGLGIAMLLLLIAAQVHTDFNELLYGTRNANESMDFLVINKKITNATSGNEKANAFTAAELADLKQQPFVQTYAPITANQYKVMADMPALGVSSMLFFESMPDEFIDVKVDSWKWTEGSSEVPIILPTNFLDLYNFGFALGQGSPQISEETVKNIASIRINVYNGVNGDIFTGRVAGFSDRITTILVPESFMRWANAKYGTEKEKAPSRIIVKTKDPSNPAFVKYLADHGFSTDKEKQRFSRYRGIVNIITSAVGFFGLVLLLFALLVFSMFIQLVVESCKYEIQLLITLGASPKQLRRYLMKQFVPMYFTIGLCSFLLVAALQWWASTVLAGKMMYISPWPGVMTIASTVIILLLVYLVNAWNVRKYIQQH